MSTDGVDGTTTMAKAKLLDAVVVVIIVIELPPVVGARTVTMVTAGTVTRTTMIIRNVLDAMFLVIGTTPVVAEEMGIVVVPNTSIVMWQILTGKVVVQVRTRMSDVQTIIGVAGEDGRILVKYKWWDADSVKTIRSAVTRAVTVKTSGEVLTHAMILQNALLAVMGRGPTVEVSP
jgi:hypothetical protein